jgi:hypothetical protein
MKRLTVGVAVLATAAAVLTSTAVALAAGESGPKCADITGENHNYAARGAINVGLILAGAPDAVSSVPCKSVTYTLVISGISGGSKVISQKGDNLFAGVTFSDADDNICISATSGSSGGKAHDTAPDVGCLEISVGSTGGGSGFQ